MYPGDVSLESRIPETVRAELARRGHKVAMKGPWSMNSSAGIMVEADMSRPPGSRITAIKVGGEPLDNAKTYRVATNDFMARGGDGYTMLRDAPHLLPDDDSPLLANEVIDYLKTIGTVRTGIEGRIILR